MDWLTGSQRRDPRGQRGFTLIEVLVVAGIIVLFAVAAGAFALGTRNYEIKAAGDRFDSLVDAAKSIARSSGNGATITIVKGVGGNGFVARVLSGRPNDLTSMKYVNMPALESNAGIKETTDLNTEPPFAIFVNSRGNMSAIKDWIYPDSGAIAQEPSCTAAITIQFYENGQKLNDGIASGSRGLSCAGYTAVNVPLIAVVTAGPVSTPTPYGAIRKAGVPQGCPPNTLCCSTGQCTPSPTPSPSATPTPSPSPSPTDIGPSPTPSPVESGPTGSPSPTPSPAPTNAVTASAAPTASPGGPGWYHWQLVGPMLAGMDQIGTNGNPPPDPQCAGGSMIQACFNGTTLNCPPGMPGFQCIDAINVAIGGTSAFASGNICNPDPGLQIPAICWRSGRPGGRTPPPSRMPPGPVLIDATSRDGILWHSCYVGPVAPVGQSTVYATYALPPSAPESLVEIRNAGGNLFSDIPYNCHNGEQ